MQIVVLYDLEAPITLPTFSNDAGEEFSRHAQNGECAEDSFSKNCSPFLSCSECCMHTLQLEGSIVSRVDVSCVCIYRLHWSSSNAMLYHPNRAQTKGEIAVGFANHVVGLYVL
jgi:hypothetical protein